MKKAFLFSIVFVLIFTTLILLSVFYLRMMQMSELDLSQSENITRVLYTRDDISSDILNYLQFSVSIQSNSTSTILNISDTLPSSYSSPLSSFNTYTSFINGTYSNQTNFLDPATNLSVISLNTTAFQSAPSIRFINSNMSLNLNYSYNNLSKNELIINGSAFVTSYYITATLNDTCFNNNCTNATRAGGALNPDSSTMGLWHFDEGNGTTVNDSSGKNNTGSLGGSPTWVGGRFGNALQFIAGPEYVLVRDSNNLDMNGNFTVELWFKQPHLIGAYLWILNKANTSYYNDSNYAIWLDSSSRIHGGISDGTNVLNVTSTNAIQQNTWYHVAFTANGASLNLYVNGVLDNSTPQTVTPAPNNLDLIIGARDPTDALWSFNGTIDDVAIYNRTKSADEIAADANLFHWDWGLIAMNSNLSAAWHFDEGTGNVSYDLSENGNTLAMNGTQTVVLQPSSSTNKAYGVNSTSAENPLLATIELNYTKITTDNGDMENTVASYSNTLSRSCQAAGTCTCTDAIGLCYAWDVCTDYGGCSYSCPSTANTNTPTSGCSVKTSGCSQICQRCSA